MFSRQSLHVAMLLWGCIFSLIAALCMFMSKNFDKEKRKRILLLQICCAALLLSDVFAWGFRGNQSSFGYYVVRISNFFVFALSDVMFLLFHEYLCYCLFGDWRRNKNNGKKIKRKSRQLPHKRIYAGYLIALSGVALVIISQFTNLYYYIDTRNLYHRNPAHILSILIPMAGMIIDLSMLIQYRKKMKREVFAAMVSYIVLPLLSTVALIFYYGISLANIAVGISMIFMFVAAMIEQNENLARKEKEAADMRISMMMSQIAPHFIYNTLSSIKYLCTSDPKTAAETVDEFSEYLRGNLNSLSETEPIPFERELKHVKNYFAIEKKRFKDRVNVEYEIEEEDFLLPALTLQPMVENAIKHGLCKKDDGGTVKIKTERRPGVVYIIIMDDGAGFDVNKKAEDNAPHVGIMNVKKRVEQMCGGTFTIESQAGVGTKVVIALPQNME